MSRRRGPLANRCQKKLLPSRSIGHHSPRAWSSIEPTVRLAREMGVLKLARWSWLDGTRIHANASRHSALSYRHAGKIEAEVAELLD
jgi:hypothetical protein